jgi:uracil-DNA glycosylase
MMRFKEIYIEEKILDARAWKKRSHVVGAAKIYDDRRRREGKSLVPCLHPHPLERERRNI